MAYVFSDSDDGAMAVTAVLNPIACSQGKPFAIRCKLLDGKQEMFVDDSGVIDLSSICKADVDKLIEIGLAEHVNKDIYYHAVRKIDWMAHPSLEVDHKAVNNFLKH